MILNVYAEYYDYIIYSNIVLGVKFDCFIISIVIYFPNNISTKILAYDQEGSVKLTTRSSQSNLAFFLVGVTQNGLLRPYTRSFVNAHILVWSKWWRARNSASNIPDSVSREVIGRFTQGMGHVGIIRVGSYSRGVQNHLGVKKISPVNAAHCDPLLPFHHALDDFFHLCISACFTLHRVTVFVSWLYIPYVVFPFSVQIRISPSSIPLLNCFILSVT